MSLSSILTKHCPKYETKIPSTGTSVWFRPFLVKEEKNLLIVQEFGTENEVLKCILNILEACYEYDKFDKLPIFDIEYLFIQLRSKSIGTEISPNITCPDTQELISIPINLNDLRVSFDKNHNKILDLGHNTILTMKYPSINLILNSETKLSDENIYDIALLCMDNIQTDSELIECGVQSKSELEDFLNNMTIDQFSKITQFFETMPKIEKEINYTTSDGVSRTIVLRGVSDFFV